MDSGTSRDEALVWHCLDVARLPLPRRLVFCDLGSTAALFMFIAFEQRTRRELVALKDTMARWYCLQSTPRATFGRSIGHQPRCIHTHD